MKEVMERTARESVYFHQDFHGALSVGIEYLHEQYGEQAVRDYLREFALSFYAPLRRALREKGLAALKDHFEALYQMFHETKRTINEALCEGSPYSAELLEYEPQSGRSVQRFSRCASAPVADQSRSGS